MKYLSLLLLIAGLGFGQEWRAVVVKPVDAAALQRAYNDYMAAKTKWEGIRIRVKVGFPETNSWASFTFSRDFKIILEGGGDSYTCAVPGGRHGGWSGNWYDHEGYQVFQIPYTDN